jgi:hypothetical protein
MNKAALTEHEGLKRGSKTATVIDKNCISGVK